MSNNINYFRILIAGKSGVGKSSFINYFLGREEAETGVGEPCTQILTRYVFSNPNGCDIELYDTKGMEILDYDNWVNEMLSELESKSDVDLVDSYHAIFYCISAEKKIEDKEIGLINEMVKAAKQPVHIILTKCDSVDNQLLNEREQYLHNNLSEGIEIYRVISIEKKKRNGTMTGKSGLKNILNSIYELLWKRIAWAIAIEAVSASRPIYEDTVEELCPILIRFIDENFGFFKLMKMIKEDDDPFEEAFRPVESRLDRMKDKIDKNLNDAVSSYWDRIDDLRETVESITGKRLDLDKDDIIEICNMAVEEQLEVIDEYFDDDEYLMKKLRLGSAIESFDDYDDPSPGEVIKALFNAGVGIFTLKSDLKNLVRELAYEVLEKRLTTQNMVNAVYEELEYRMYFY